MSGLQSVLRTSSFSNSIVFAAIIVFNSYSPVSYAFLCTGCLTHNLKDRSAGTLIRYNWIEDENRQLDIVDSEHSELINNEGYYSSLVNGNFLIEHEGQAIRQITHNGSDAGNTTNFHNTTYSNRLKSTLLRLSTNDESAELRNNIIVGSDLAIVDESGVVNMKNNWLAIGWVNSHSNLSGSEPGFVSITDGDFHLTADSAGIGHADLASQIYPLQWEYSAPQNGVQRVSLDDLGAYDY